MFRHSPYLLLSLLACSGEPGAGAANGPALVVLCSVDQLATRVLDSALPHMGDDGFRRLLREGIRFPDCAFAHGCTSTGPGHATLSTGATATGHGIIGNQWRDPETGASVYCAGQREVETLYPDGAGRALGPDGILAPTLGEAMREGFGADVKIASVSWKDRSAILMGGPAADVAVWARGSTGQMITNRRYVETVPNWLQAFNDRRLPDSWLGWRWERVASLEAYADLEDDRGYESSHADGSHTLPQVIGGGMSAPSSTFYSRMGTSPLGNKLILETALAAVEGMELGADSTPDLLCVGFSANDLVGHAFGPDSVEVRDVLLRTDLAVARLLEVLDQKVGAGRYVFLLSSDHGVGAIPEAALAAGLDAGRAWTERQAAAAAEPALIAKYGSPEGTRYVIPAAGQLYLNRAALELAGADRLEAAKIAVAAAAEVDSVALAVTLAELLADRDTDDPMRQVLRASVHPDRSGDVILVPNPNWIPPASRASHGTPYGYDREVPFLAMGPGLPAGQLSQQSVTPGIGVVLAAHSLGIPPPSGAVDDLPAGW